MTISSEYVILEEVLWYAFDWLHKLAAKGDRDDRDEGELFAYFSILEYGRRQAELHGIKLLGHALVETDLHELIDLGEHRHALPTSGTDPDASQGTAAAGMCDLPASSTPDRRAMEAVMHFMLHHARQLSGKGRSGRSQRENGMLFGYFSVFDWGQQQAGIFEEVEERNILCDGLRLVDPYRLI